jgi:hypothetical protein
MKFTTTKLKLIFLLIVPLIVGCSHKKKANFYSTEHLRLSFLNHPKWDKGKAEISTYELKVESSLLFENETTQKTDVDTLVLSVTKHLFDTETLRKVSEKNNASVKDVFLMVQLLRKDLFNVGTNHTTTLQFDKTNLQPYKLSISKNSYEGNTYVEQQFFQNVSEIEQYYLGDGVSGNKTILDYDKPYYPIEQIPFLVRVLKLEMEESWSFQFVTYKMDVPFLAKPFVGDNIFELQFSKIGEEQIVLNGNTIVAEVIQVDYQDDIFPPVKTIGGLIPKQEKYWISKDSERMILKVEGKGALFKKDSIKAESGYKLSLIDNINMDWWNKGESFNLRSYLKAFRYD